jgi:hypothetical protein
MDAASQEQIDAPNTSSVLIAKRGVLYRRIVGGRHSGLEVEVKDASISPLAKAEVLALIDGESASALKSGSQAADLSGVAPDVRIPSKARVPHGLESIPVTPEAPFALVNEAESHYWGPFEKYDDAQVVADALESSEGPISTYTLASPSPAPSRASTRLSFGR